MNFNFLAMIGNTILGDDKPQGDPCEAAVLAVTVVSQVLDEAFGIAKAAKDSGQPWQYVSSLTKHLNEMCDEEMTFATVFNGDTQYMNDNIENLSDTIDTSTPQKSTVQGIKSTIIIGQGDEEFEVTNNELRKSTSMIINHLFDMSDLDHVYICDDEPDVIPINRSSQNSVDQQVLISTMAKIIDSYVNNAFNIIFAQEGQGDNLRSDYCESADLTEKSSYSFLSDSADIPKEACINMVEVVCEPPVIKELVKIEGDDKKNVNEELPHYENTYLTLNRDYELYSEDDEPVLQDPKTMPMQEVELLTANTSSENIQPPQVQKELTSSGMSTSATGSRKSSLVRRCRLQGARLLSCFRGWWWRHKLPGRRKVPRAPGSIRGLCPLSPDARRRAASLLDQRYLRTPSPSTSLVWKFNTVNEALVHSSRWKEYGLKMSLNENDEF